MAARSNRTPTWWRSSSGKRCIGRNDESLRGQAELLLAKQRNGPVGKIDLVFLHEFTKFENRAADLGDAEE